MDINNSAKRAGKGLRKGLGFFFDAFDLVLEIIDMFGAAKTSGRKRR